MENFRMMQRRNTAAGARTTFEVRYWWQKPPALAASALVVTAFVFDGCLPWLAVQDGDRTRGLGLEYALGLRQDMRFNQ